MDWVNSGLFDREKLIYERHLSEGVLSKVYWITYGRKDKTVADNLRAQGCLDPRIVVCSMPFGFGIPKVGSWCYSFAAPWVQRRVLRQVDVLKTNQLDGGWAAALGKRFWGKPMIARCGYVQSKLEAALRRLPRWRVRLMCRTEGATLTAADVGIVTSMEDKSYIEQKFRLSAEKIRVIPNAVDTRRFPFQPTIPGEKRSGRVLYVGRIIYEKNLENLVKASARAKMGLDVVGTGPLMGELRSFSSGIRADVRFLGTVPNGDMPLIMKRYRVFALTSLFEGQPKALLEAMASGMICVGTNVNGIKEIIEDGVNGFLAEGTDAEAIQSALLRANRYQTDLLSRNARRTIEERFSMERCAISEAEIFKELR